MARKEILVDVPDELTPDEVEADRQAAGNDLTADPYDTEAVAVADALREWADEHELERIESRRLNGAALTRVVERVQLLRQAADLLTG